jgi:probable DNA repair protein
LQNSETSAADVVLCATQRLARRLRTVSGAGVGSPVLATRTIGQWLDEIVDTALLCGALAEDPLAGALVLSGLQERKLWQRVIETALRKDEAAALFSLDGLARAAQEAHALAATWRLPIQRADRSQLSEEAQRFIDWRRDFLRRCQSAGRRDVASHLVWQIDRIAEGLGELPSRIAFAGFDRFNPQENRLREVLVARGVELVEWPLAVTAAGEGSPRQCRFADVDAELRALAHWVGEQTKRDPDARIGIVVPDLAASRAVLCRVLDETLAPDSFAFADTPASRLYNVSLGEALASLPLIRTALALLRIAQTPWQIEQATLGELLTGIGWSRDLAEADARARFEARCRARLPALVSLERVLRMARGEVEKGASIKALVAGLEALQQWAVRAKGRRLPSLWATSFRELLDTLGWPGERALSSDEYQARQAFLTLLQSLGGLDDLLGELDASDALSALFDACGETVFQPETEGSPNIQVLGMLEAATESFDALWVCGLTDGAWPPPARPNPLLPAEWQRIAGCPNASPEVQSAFAGGIQRRFLQNAPQIVFSSPQREGERELQASPLLNGIPLAEDGQGDELEFIVPSGRIARLQAAAPPLEAVPDAQAPPVAEHEKVAGGTWLLRAQAICPAWAFFQYRLGANCLETPVEGLDARGRGRLVHLVLEAFWRGRWLAQLKEATAAELEAWMFAAVDAGMAAHAGEPGAAGAAPLPARFATLERARLFNLLAAWVGVELQREVDFYVVACEEAHDLDLNGIAVSIVVDRIDETEDGERLVIDYKTGRSVDAKSWAAERISEPQLPIYATHTVAPLPLAGIAFAQVVLEKPGFVGISRDGGLLPKVKGLAEARKLYPEEQFADWPALLAHWERAVHNVAAEVRAGDARVSFTEEAVLAYCDVLALLRLPERRRLYEAALAAGEAGGNVAPPTEENRPRPEGLAGDARTSGLEKPAEESGAQRVQAAPPPRRDPETPPADRNGQQRLFD